MVYATFRIIRDCKEAFDALFGLTRRDLLDQSFSTLYGTLADFVRRPDV